VRVCRSRIYPRAEALRKRRFSNSALKGRPKEKLKKSKSRDEEEEPCIASSLSQEIASGCKNRSPSKKRGFWYDELVDVLFDFCL